MNTFSIKSSALGLAVGCALLLSACDGGSSADAAATTPTSSFRNTTGPVDPVQSAVSTLGSSVATTPAVGNSLQLLTESLVCVADSVDVLAASLQALAQTQNPAQFAQLQSALGPAITCGSDNAIAALEGLISGGPLAGTPAQAPIQQAITQLTVLQSLTGSGSVSSGNLTAVTNQLVTVSNTLATAVTQIPAVPNAPQVRVLTSLLSLALGNLSTVLDKTGKLDSAGTGAAVVQLVQNFALVLGTSNLTGQAVVDNAFRTAALTVVGSSLSAVPVVQSTLVSILSPLFSALSTVLSGVGGPTQFAGVLSGLLAGNPLGAGLTTPLSLLDGGGLTSIGGQIPTLGSVLALLGL